MAGFLSCTSIYHAITETHHICLGLQLPLLLLVACFLFRMGGVASASCKDSALTAAMIGNRKTQAMQPSPDSLCVVSAHVHAVAASKYPRYPCCILIPKPRHRFQKREQGAWWFLLAVYVLLSSWHALVSASGHSAKFTMKVPSYPACRLVDHSLICTVN